MMETQIPTPNQFINGAVVKHPSLFAASSYELSKFKVLDHFLNTIGNGIRNNFELNEKLTSVQPIDDATRYFEEPRTVGYLETISYPSGYEMANVGGASVKCFVSEKDQYPEVKVWIDDELDTVFKPPYPNFSKEYSVVWRCSDFVSLGADWVESAIWFYKKAKEFIQENESEYGEAFPSNSDRENANCVANILKYFGSRTNEEISVAFGYPYDGDIEKFLIGRWQQRKQKIFEFIDETVKMLEESR